MILNFHLLAGLISWSLVSAHNGCDQHACIPRAWSHVAEPIVFPVTRRQLLPPRNSTEPTSLTRTLWTTKTVSEGFGLTTYDPVPSQTSSHGTFPTSQVLGLSSKKSTASLEDSVHRAQSRDPLVQPAQNSHGSFSSTVVSARLTPLSSGLKTVPLATGTVYTLETTSIIMQVQSIIPTVAPTTSRAGNLTWPEQPATPSLFHPVISSSLHPISSTSTLFIGGSSALFNVTLAVGATPSTTVPLVPTSQHHQTMSISQASQSKVAKSSTVFTSSTPSNQTMASGVFVGWNRTISAAGAPVTTRVITYLASPTANLVSVNGSSYNTGPSSSSFNLSRADLQESQSRATTTVDLSSQSGQSSATVQSSPSHNDGRIITIHTTTLTATQSATESAAGAPIVPPPLTTSQTAGVAIAGTTGILIAIVAVLYVARRHRSRNARRSSTGSIYPKIAYLYDPPPDDQAEKSYHNPTMMSGGIYTRSATTRNNSLRMYGSPYQGKHSYSGSLPPYTCEAEDEGRRAIPWPRSGPCEHKEYTYKPAHFTDHRSANLNGDIVSSLGSPTQHAGWQPMPSSRRPITRSASAAQNSILSDISAAACSTGGSSGRAKQPRIST